MEREQYVNSYQRSVETFQKWADAYAALLVSTSLIVVVAMIYDIGSMFVFLLTGTMFIMSFFGTFIIYKSAPYEIKNYQNNKGPKERQRARLLLLVLCPIGALGAVYLTFSTGLGHAFLFAGVCLMPGGVFAYLDDSKVSKIDEEGRQVHPVPGQRVRGPGQHRVGRLGEDRQAVLGDSGALHPASPTAPEIPHQPQGVLGQVH